MAVHRPSWARIFSNLPMLPCPSCDIGQLRENHKATVEKETRNSKGARSFDEWEPEWYEGRFSSQLICTNPRCGDIVFTCGRTWLEPDVEEDPNGNPQLVWTTHYEPRYFEPAPPVFAIQVECPKAVSDQIERAFSLIWSDHAACANRLRVALEIIMDDQGIQRKKKIKNGKKKGTFRKLTLHERIEIFENKEPEAFKQLMALKWLGNAGSHGEYSDLSRDDLLDAFEHFEFGLELVYVRRASKLQSRAEKIIAAKGSAKKTKKLK